MAALIVKNAWSAPPVTLHVTDSLAVNVCTAVRFSATDFVLVAAPAPPVGPVITGLISSRSVTRIRSSACPMAWSSARATRSGSA